MGCLDKKITELIIELTLNELYKLESIVENRIQEIILGDNEK